MNDDYDDYKETPPTKTELKAEIARLSKQIGGLKEAPRVTVTIENWCGMKNVEWTGYLNRAIVDDELEPFARLGSHAIGASRGHSGLKLELDIMGYDMKCRREDPEAGDKPVAWKPLSIRATNVLKRLKCDSLTDAKDKWRVGILNEMKLRSAYASGPKTVKEIMKALV